MHQKVALPLKNNFPVKKSFSSVMTVEKFVGKKSRL